MARKATELRPVMTRIPERLRRRLEKEAARNDRSMNSEIVRRLEQSFEREDQEAVIKTTAVATATEVFSLWRHTLVPISQRHTSPPHTETKKTSKTARVGSEKR